MEKSTVSISKRTFLIAVIILLILMTLAGILTRVVPTGSFERDMVEGSQQIIPESFTYSSQDPLPFWRVYTAPIEVLFAPGNITIIGIILFLCIIGASINILNKTGVLTGMIARIAQRFKEKKHLLLAVITFVFMCLGAFMGIFEEVIALIPIVITLSFQLGWDSLTGLGMVLLASGFGFSAAVSNPFSIGVAQTIAGIPVFSGSFFRLIIFFIVYCVVLLFLRRHVKKIEAYPKASYVYEEDKSRKEQLSGKVIIEEDGRKETNAAIAFFAMILMVLFIYLIVATLNPFIADYSLLIIAFLFLIAGLGSGLIMKAKLRTVGRFFLEGLLGILPGVLLILLASSVKHIISEGGIMDTILNYAFLRMENATPFVAILTIYGLVLFMNFFIGSASAKAFLIMPIVAPLSEMIGLNKQMAVLAFQFGDGFSNIIYPTNAALLISLGLTTVSYTKWFKWTLKIQLTIFVLTILFLYLALKMNYGQ
jgi:uncharacterized ion transporter superfamily protein YfcC